MPKYGKCWADAAVDFNEKREEELRKGWKGLEYTFLVSLDNLPTVKEYLAALSEKLHIDVTAPLVIGGLRRGGVLRFFVAYANKPVVYNYGEDGKATFVGIKFFGNKDLEKYVYHKILYGLDVEEAWPASECP
jgi:hypothetical protein